MYTNHYHPEIEADRLLAAIVRDDRPHYRDEHIERKAKVDRRRGRELAIGVDGASESASLLRRRSLRRVLLSAQLTRRQAQVFSAKLAGYGWYEIGRRFGHSKQAAQGIFKQALCKIRRAWRTYPLAGIEEVYRQEVNRHSHKRH